MFRMIILALIAAMQVMPADARIVRSAAAKAAFAKLHPCPATHKPIPHCPGYVIDHVKPLCAGGADRPSNMQWQTIAVGKKKDSIERRTCAGTHIFPSHISMGTQFFLHGSHPSGGSIVDTPDGSHPLSLSSPLSLRRGRAESRSARRWSR
jgi:hypothetical protein